MVNPTREIMAQFRRSPLIIFVVLLVLRIDTVFGSKEGELKLIDGMYDYQGVLQIFHENAWGNICNVNWDFEDAEVACRELGYPGAALSSAPFDITRPSGDVWLTDLGCNGDEKSLLDCSRSEWNVQTNECMGSGRVVQLQCRVSSYLGCVDTSEESPVMTGKAHSDESNLTVTSCIAECRADGFPYAGVQAPSTCVCGTVGEATGATSETPFDKCNVTCPGSDRQICGGVNYMGVYDVAQGNCGGKYAGKNLNIVSPGFPGKYQAGYTCVWEADVSANSYTTVRLPMLSLGEQDSLQIHLGTDLYTLNYESYFETKMAESVTKVVVRFTSSPDSPGSGGFMLTLTDDSYCPSEDVTNGTMVMEDDVMYRPGQRVEVECNEGYTPYRKETICQTNGKWIPEPRCVVYNKWNTFAFKKTVLFIAIIVVGVLFIMFMLTICYLVCGDTKKKNEGYYGINTDSGEAHAHDGQASPNKEDYKAVDMENAGDIDEEAREAAIPLATEADV